MARFTLENYVIVAGIIQLLMGVSSVLLKDTMRRKRSFYSSTRNMLVLNVISILYLLFFSDNTSIVIAQGALLLIGLSSLELDGDNRNKKLFISYTGTMIVFLLSAWTLKFFEITVISFLYLCGVISAWAIKTIIYKIIFKKDPIY